MVGCMCTCVKIRCVGQEEVKTDENGFLDFTEFRRFFELMSATVKYCKRTKVQFLSVRMQKSGMRLQWTWTSCKGK